MKLYLHSTRGRAGGEKNESALQSHERERADLAEGINLGHGVPWLRRKEEEKEEGVLENGWELPSWEQGTWQRWVVVYP